MDEGGRDRAGDAVSDSIITWACAVITWVAAGYAIWSAMQARRSVKRIREIQSGRRR